MNSNKRIALTIDDLPFVASGAPSKQDVGIEITDSLLGHLRQNDVKVTGFVIGKNSDEHLLRQWHRDGHLLASHTYSHLRLSTISSEDFEKEVIRNEQILAPFLANSVEKYFRFPYLDYGSTVEQRDRALEFLYKRSYTVAPVTIDSCDYIYNEYYTRAWQNEDVKTMQDAIDEYLEYTEKVIAFRERQAMRFFGRPVGLIMLIHANRINAYGLDGLITGIKQMGYAFVSLSEVLNESDSRRNNRILGQNYYSFEAPSDDGTYRRIDCPKVSPAVLEVYKRRLQYVL